MLSTHPGDLDAGRCGYLVVVTVQPAVGQPERRDIRLTGLERLDLGFAGPLQLTGDSLSTNPPTLFRNPYAWTRLANVLILNGPAPVGFSYCLPAGPAGDGESCGSWNDTRTAVFNVNFINGFFASFPEFAKAPFYIAGESYAGVYVGMITQMQLDAKTPLNLKGIALGDVCMGTDVLCGQASNEWSGPWFGLLFDAGQGCI